MINSRLGLFSAAPSGSSVYLHPTRAPLLPKLRGQFAEFLNGGSLARLGILSPPTCVGFRYGHRLAFVRGFSRQCGLSHFGTYISLPFTSRALRGTDLPAPHPTGLDAPFQPRAWPTLLRHPFLKRPPVASDYPPIPHHLRLYGLGLGPGLPWADEPSPGILRLSAGRILTCLFAYLYRHSHFPPVHHTSQCDFYPVGTLPYHLRGEM